MNSPKRSDRRTRPHRCAAPPDRSTQQCRQTRRYRRGGVTHRRHESPSSLRPVGERSTDDFRSLRREHPRANEDPPSDGSPMGRRRKRCRAETRPIAVRLPDTRRLAVREVRSPEGVELTSDRSDPPGPRIATWSERASGRWGRCPNGHGCTTLLAPTVEQPSGHAGCPTRSRPDDRYDTGINYRRFGFQRARPRKPRSDGHYGISGTRTTALTALEPSSRTQPELVADP